MSQRKWIIRDEAIPQEKIYTFMEESGYGYLLSTILLTRGIRTKEEATAFLTPKDAWEDPYLLPDMEKALNRIKKAKKNMEKVAVFGDYDADGVTATAIMEGGLKAYGLDVTHYLPDRNSEGYGLNEAALTHLAKEGVKLIVTVDCGVSCREEIRYSETLGLDVIVTDHHTCPEVLPECEAVVEPKRRDSRYPFDALAGAGVAYKVIEALLGREKAAEFLPYAAIGTIADVVDLTGENRKIVIEGLNMINNGACLGIQTLLYTASKRPTADAGTVAYILAPRINCAGRMDHPEKAYRLITAETETEASMLSGELNELNRKRQKTEQDIYEEAIQMIRDEKLYEDGVIVVGKKGWHAGVIGIAAAKVAEASCRPAILISCGEDGVAHGSGRSVEGFDLYEALKHSEATLQKYGGHALAAGISLESEKIPEFRNAINAYADEVMPDKEHIRKVYIDSIPPVSAVTIKNIEELSLLEPCGAGNAKPVFAFTNVKIGELGTLSEGKHLKLSLVKDGCTLKAVAFNMGAFEKKMYKGMTIHAAGQLEVNDYTGQPQLIIKDILY